MSTSSTTYSSAGWQLQHSYAQLPSALHRPQLPTPVKKAQLVVLNTALAAELGLNPDALEQQADVFAGNTLPPGAEPLAQAYAGHQYGHFTMLGDGRAILLGEQRTPTGQRVDIQLKGAGPTPYSRRGDGRAALGPMLREYVISEAMHALGIPTTRSLAVATTGEAVYRQTPLPGAVLTRTAASHIRVGTFEYAAARSELPLLQALADYTLQRHYPDVAVGDYLALLHAILQRQAALLAQWMSVGFIHGVMNTDNMALSGETIDYGPCAFMDHYDPATVFSSIDHHGRYAYGSQPRIAQWNLARLAEAMLPLLHPEEKTALQLANEAVDSFQLSYEQQWLRRMSQKLAIPEPQPQDAQLIHALLTWMQSRKADYTTTFADLSCGRLQQHQDTELALWHQQWQQRCRSLSTAEQQRLMQDANPAIIPRNHLVEEALSAASSETRPRTQQAL
jgi:serine/tyrosine/threonine adenylyltransferase